jgi:hypothetical protein
LAGSTQELSGSTPLTRIWSIRSTGKDAGQVKPKPFPAMAWAECSCAVIPANARSSMVPFRSPSSTTRLLGSAAMAWPSACTPMSREAVQKPARGVTRTDPGWAT